jgi:hypothetical protein
MSAIEETEYQLSLYRKKQEKEQVEYIYIHYRLFLYQYVNFLKYGHIGDKANYPLLSFVGIIKEIPTTKMFETWHEDEIFDELFIKLLYFIKDYKDEKIVKYISNCFKFRIKEWLMELRKDVLYRYEKLTNIEDTYNLSDNSYEMKEISDNNVELKSINDYIVYLYNNKNLSIEQLGKLFKISKEKALKLKNRALKALS